MLQHALAPQLILSRNAALAQPGRNIPTKICAFGGVPRGPACSLHVPLGAGIYPGPAQAGGL